ncbi:MAG: hypothetical protein ACRDI0_10845 [Actinomycetota bacterium]
MIALPVAATAVSLAFGAHLLVRAGRRGSWAEATWGVAMLMFAAASAALALGVADGWSAGEFHAYWLFGAVLNVPYLALGELYLLVRPRAVVHALLVVTLLGTVWASAEVRSARVDETVLAGRDFFAGRQVLGEDSPAVALARLYSLPAYAVLVLGALWSAFRMRGDRRLRSRFYGTLLIAAGATVVAVGAIFARRGDFAGFSITLSAGVAVMYWGFLSATRASSPGAPRGTARP